MAGEKKKNNKKSTKTPKKPQQTKVDRRSPTPNHSITSRRKALTSFVLRC